MSNPFKTLKEAWFPTKVDVVQQGVAVLGGVEQSYGVRLSPTFKDQVTVFNEDPIIKESILQFAEQVISTGIFTTGAEYPLELPNPAGGKWTAKECIDEWNKQNNLDAKILTIASELFGFGNSFYNIVDGLNYIPIQSIENAMPATKGISIRDKYDLKLTGSFGSEKISSGDFIHFKSNIIGVAPFGTGIIYSLITVPANAPSLYALRQSIRKSMKAGFEKFSFGNELWTFEGLSDAKIQEIGAKITEMAESGQRIATNVKGDIKIAVPQRTTSYDAWMTLVQNEVLMSLTNPSLKLGLEQGFTKATAEAALSMFEAKIESLRRVIKRQVEKLWLNVLNANGFDGAEANIELHFGSPEIEYDSADLFKAVELGLVTPEEARTILRDSMKWKLETQALKVDTTGDVVEEAEKETEKKINLAKESRQLSLDELRLENVKGKNALLKRILGADNENTSG